MPKTTLMLLGLVALFVFAGPMMWQPSPYEFDAQLILAAPSLVHPMGCDILGRDVMARLMEGGRMSLLIGFLSAAIATALALIAGMVAAMLRGWVDRGVVVVIDLLLSFPTFFLLLALVAYVDASQTVLIGVIGLTGWMSLARMMRAEAFGFGSKPYIKIARMAAMPTWKIAWRYYLPLLGPLGLVGFVFGASGAILAESGLSFLGLGIMPPQMSWGTVLADGKEVVDVAWWLSFFPGLMIFMVTLGLIGVADALQAQANKKSYAS